MSFYFYNKIQVFQKFSEQYYEQKVAADKPLLWIM